jgi:hypothetical protein
MHLQSLSVNDVQNWVEHIIDPQRLLLAWQAPDQFGDRFRWAVGEITRDEGNYTFRYLRGTQFESLNGGRTESELTALGYRGYPAFKRRQIVHTHNVVALFLRRVPPRGRSDFKDYKELFRLRAEMEVSDFALLGITEAKLPSDGFSLVDPLDDGSLPRELLLEVAGHRYYRNLLPRRPIVGESVEFVPEPDNIKDPNAVKVRIDEQCMGYVNRLQSNAFLRWVAQGRVTAIVERINGSTDRPRVFIFARIAPFKANGNDSIKAAETEK